MSSMYSFCMDASYRQSLLYIRLALNLCVIVIMTGMQVTALVAGDVH